MSKTRRRYVVELTLGELNTVLWGLSEVSEVDWNKRGSTKARNTAINIRQQCNERGLKTLK